MIDTERDQSNNCDNYLAADSNAAEGVTTVMDVLSNGFKLTNPYTSTNGAGIEYVYIAFAEVAIQIRTRSLIKQLTMLQLNGKTLRYGKAFVTEDGRQFPANWLAACFFGRETIYWYC